MHKQLSETSSYMSHNTSVQESSVILKCPLITGGEIGTQRGCST